MNYVESSKLTVQEGLEAVSSKFQCSGGTILAPLCLAAKAS